MAAGVLRVRSSSSMWSSLRSISSRRRRIRERLSSEVMTSQHRRKRPQPEGDGGMPGRGLSQQSGSNSASSLCGGGRSVLVLCFSHVTFRPISLSRFAHVRRLVHLRQRFVRRCQNRMSQAIAQGGRQGLFLFTDRHPTFGGLAICPLTPAKPQTILREPRTILAFGDFC